VEEPKKEKKAKKEKKEAEAAPAAEEPKKEKKAKKEKKEAEAAPAAEEPKEKKKKKKAEAEAAEEAPPAKKPKVEEPAAAAPSEDGAGRVYIGNLPWSVTEEQLKDLFKSSGSISNIEWLMHTDTGKFKGAVFAQFGGSSEAQAAVSVNGSDLDGRAIKVEIATPRKTASGAPRDLGPGEPSSSIFLGNLSYTVEEDSIRQAFEECGTVTRVKWLEKEGQFTGNAFIDFATVEEATKAVAKNGEMMDNRPMRINFAKGKTQTNDGGKGGKGAGKPQRSYKPENPKPDGCVEIFCGNLPYSIDDDKIYDFFKDAGKVVNTRWLNDKETQEFKGIGFVTFETTEEVDKAVELAGQYLDGRQIRIDYAGAKKQQGAWGGGGGGGW